MSVSRWLDGSYRWFWRLWWPVALFVMGLAAALLGAGAIYKAWGGDCYATNEYGEQRYIVCDTRPSWDVSPPGRWEEDQSEWHETEDGYLMEMYPSGKLSKPLSILPDYGVESGGNFPLYPSPYDPYVIE